MAPSQTSAKDTLQAPFLDGSDSEVVGRKSVVQRAAGLHWPDPTAAVLFLTCMGGCACIADRAQGAGGEVTPAGLQISLAAQPQESSNVALMVLAMLLVSALVCQYVFEKFMARLAMQALCGLSPDVRVELGRMRVWVFRGRAEIRNCIVHNPVGYGSDSMLRVRSLSVDFDVPRCIRSLGSVVEIRSLNLQGVSVEVEKGCAPQESNVQAVVSKLEDAGKSDAKPSLLIREVAITDAAVTEGGLAGRSTIPDMHYADFSKEEEVGNPHQAMSVILKQIQKGAIVSLGQQIS